MRQEDPQNKKLLVPTNNYEKEAECMKSIELQVLGLMIQCTEHWPVSYVYKESNGVALEFLRN